MGARAYMGPRLQQVMPRAISLRLHRAPRAREPGRGLPGRPRAEQSRIVRTALDLSVPLSQYPVKTPGER